MSEGTATVCRPDRLQRVIATAGHQMHGMGRFIPWNQSGQYERAGGGAGGHATTLDAEIESECVGVIFAPKQAHEVGPALLVG